MKPFERRSDAITKAIFPRRHSLPSGMPVLFRPRLVATLRRKPRDRLRVATRSVDYFIILLFITAIRTAAGMGLPAATSPQRGGYGRPDIFRGKEVVQKNLSWTFCYVLSSGVMD